MCWDLDGGWCWKESSIYNNSYLSTGLGFFHLVSHEARSNWTTPVPDSDDDDAVRAAAASAQNKPSWTTTTTTMICFLRAMLLLMYLFSFLIRPRSKLRVLIWFLSAKERLRSATNNEIVLVLKLSINGQGLLKQVWIFSFSLSVDLRQSKSHFRRLLRI